MNFRKELAKIRAEKKYSAAEKAIEFLENSCTKLRELPSFKSSDGILIFPSATGLVMRNTNGSPIYTMEFDNAHQIDAVYRAVRAKLTDDGCNYGASNEVKDGIVLGD